MRYVPEHEANASHVEVETRVHTCVTQIPAVPQYLEPSTIYPTDEQEGERDSDNDTMSD